MPGCSIETCQRQSLEIDGGTLKTAFVETDARKQTAIFGLARTRRTKEKVKRR